MASILFLLDINGMLPCDKDVAYLAVLIFFITAKLLYFLRRVDCVAPLENAFCYIFFGGLVDDVDDRLMAYIRSHRETEKEKEK